MKPMTLLTARPREPFVGLALAAIAGIFIADVAPQSSFAIAIGLALLAVIALATRNSLAVYAAVACSFFFLHSLRVTDSPALRLARELGAAPRPISVRGAVVSEPRSSANGTFSFLLEANTIELDGATRPCRVKFLARWHRAVEFGDEIELFGTAEEVRGPRNPGEFDMRSFLARQDVQRELIVRYPENGAILHHSGGNIVLRAAQKSRRWMRAVLSRDLENSPDVTGAISGMVLGLRHQTPEDIEEPFQQTGTLHLFAVAGLHVGIVAQLLWILAQVARLSRKWATALIIPALFFYAAITGWHTSSVRASVMSAVLLGGLLVERKPFQLNSLAAAAALILCWDTNELFSIGFQLSFFVVAAIILFAGPTFEFLRRRFEPDPFLPQNLFGARRRALQHLLSWMARAGAVSFAAWIGSLPLMFAYYHLITPISLLANLVVIPLAFFVLAGGLMSMLTAPFSSWLSVVFNNANWSLTKLILGAVHFFAQVPEGHFYIEHPHWPTGAGMEITALDFRSGAAVHLRTGKRDWLIDAGPARDYDRVLRQYLRSRGINRLEGLVLTHGDASDIGGAEGVWRDFHPRRLIDTSARDRSPIHHKLIAMLGSGAGVREIFAAEQIIQVSRDVTAKVLFPPPGFQADNAEDQALVFQLLLGGQARALLMSDSGAATEDFLMEHYPNLQADILIKGQHHSGVSGSLAFLDRVQPQAIIATSRDFPDYERIKEEWAEAVRSRGIKLFRQDETGSVQIRFFHDHWEAKNYVTSETFRSTSR
ncbi:MAG TPA: ComEC/Rec2 family competence protein [Chthoniobacterales bacterium]